MSLILEGLVTTVDDRGCPHLASMGPSVDDVEFSCFELRPYRTSQTFRNLKRHGEGVLHITDDVLLIAQVAVGVEAQATFTRASSIQGFVLADCCRYFEFRVGEIDESQERARMVAVVAKSGRCRDFFGLNRGKHAVLEAAILVTRLDFLPREQIETEFARLRPLVEKTGGVRERQAFLLLNDFVAHRVHSNGSRSNREPLAFRPASLAADAGLD